MWYRYISVLILVFIVIKKYIFYPQYIIFKIIPIQLMDEVLKYIFEYLVMGQLKFGMENRFIILLKCNQNCPQLLAITHSKK